MRRGALASRALWLVALAAGPAPATASASSSAAAARWAAIVAEGGLGGEADAGVATLSAAVPFVPQGPQLCGGAALAMVLRYWGETGVSAEDYQSLVDPDASGIRAGDLAAAARSRPGWRAAIFAGSFQELRNQLARDRPVIALIQVGPGRFHYVVVTAVDSKAIRYHDPAVGPAREADAAEFLVAWKGSRCWGLVITPQPGAQPGRTLDAARSPGAAPPARIVLTAGPCDSLVDAGVQQALNGNTATAESLFTLACSRFPRSARPWRELAGLRFKTSHWRDAEQLAGEALARVPSDTLAWKLMAASRFMADDAHAALAAWNAVGEPRVDLVQIEGLHRTRHAVALQCLDLGRGTLLTASRLRRAQRRLDSLPAVDRAALRYQPGPDGDAQVEAAVLEAPESTVGFRTAFGFLAHAVAAGEFRPMLTAPTGSGERLDVAWRWESERPLIGVRCSAPTPCGLPGLLTLEGFRERETYRVWVDGTAVGQRVEEVRRRGSLAWSDWVSGSLRIGGSLAYDHWRNRGSAAAIGATLEAVSSDDRWRVFGASEGWSLGSGVLTGRALVTWSPLGLDRRAHVDLRAGVDAAGVNAPLSLLPGAGVGRARPVLLRAHPLLDDGILAGPVFGRRLVHGGIEATWWPMRLPARVGVAVFVDAAQAWRSPLAETTTRGCVDAGVGLRVAVPGGVGTLRLDVAWGLSDEGRAITLIATPWKFS